MSYIRTKEKCETKKIHYGDGYLTGETYHMIRSIFCGIHIYSIYIYIFQLF